MSKRRHPRPAARRRAPARLFAGNSLYRRALRYEPLEDRRLLAVVTVDTLADTVDFNDGHTSLREAIFATNTVPGADTINFAPALTANGPATILLTQGELKITDALTITGPGASALTINAAYGNSSTTGPIPNLFNIDDGTSNFIDVSIGGLTLTASTQATFGSLIRSTENLTVTNSTLAGNHVAGFGINNQLGNLMVAGSTVSGNRATGVSSGQGSATISYSTISGNGQGGVYTRGGWQLITRRSLEIRASDLAAAFIVIRYRRTPNRSRLLTAPSTTIRRASAKVAASASATVILRSSGASSPTIRLLPRAAACRLPMARFRC